MINGIKKETIVSTTEDRLTLLNWLKKLEKTLSDDTLTDIAFTDDNGNVSLALTFEDGTTKSVAFPYDMSAFAKKSEVTSGLALKANVSGQAFTGAITAPSITETMTGYSFVKSASHGQYFSLSYVGASKTGNKLTFVLAGTMNFPDVSQVYTIGNFVIPEAIGKKLYPITGSQIAFLSINAQINYVSRVIVSGIFNKNSSSNIDVRVYSAGLTANTDYHFRIEQTFLLSDNLAS